MGILIVGAFVGNCFYKWHTEHEIAQRQKELVDEEILLKKELRRKMTAEADIAEFRRDRVFGRTYPVTPSIRVPAYLANPNRTLRHHMMGLMTPYPLVSPEFEKINKSS